MLNLSALAIRRPVATAMVYLILIVIGLVAVRTLPVDLLPKVEFTELTVRVGYPNVGPEEIEQIITDPIENAISGLPDLERITSRSQEGSSRIRLRFARGSNIDEAANDLRPALDRADQIAADLRRRMEALPGITDVRVSRREGQPEDRLLLDCERIAELGRQRTAGLLTTTAARPHRSAAATTDSPTRLPSSARPPRRRPPPAAGRNRDRACAARGAQPGPAPRSHRLLRPEYSRSAEQSGCDRRSDGSPERL